MTTYRSPLCLDLFDSSEFTNNEWARCSCGHWFTEQTLIEFRDSRENLSVAQKKFADIREYARTSSAAHSLEMGQSYAPSQSSTASSTTVYQSAPAVNGIPSDQPRFQPAPVAVQAPVIRRERNLPTLSTSQWLLTVMAGLIAIALTIFFSVTWDQIPALGKVGVVAALTVGFSFGAIKAKKYFVALANVLAIIASVTTFISLQSLSRYEILPKAWADGENTPFVSIMLAIVTAGSLLMGRRFKVWGWLIIAPVGAAVSSILFTYNYVGTLLSDGYNHAGYQIAMLSLAILGVVVVARFTRLEEPVIPALPKAKKDQTEEVVKEIAEAEYQLELHNKEQVSLSLASKFSIFAILGYLAFLAGSIATQIFPFTKGIAGQEFLGVDPVGLIIAAVLWMTGAALLNKFGGGFTSAGEVSTKLANFIWTTAFSMTAFAVAYSAQWVSGDSSFAILLTGALLGSVMIFAQSFIPRVSADVSARLGSLVGSIVLWGISLSLWAFDGQPKSSSELVAFTMVVSVALLTRSAVFQIPRAARFSSAVYFGGLLIYIFTNGSSDIFGGEDLVPVNIFLSFAISLAATGAWNVALTLLRERIGIESKFVSGLQTFGVAIFTFIALFRELSNVLPTSEALDILPLLEVLTGFGLVFMALALIPALRAIEDLRKTLAYSSFILLAAGFLSFGALGVSSGFGAENYFPLLSAYTLMVMTVLAVYGVMARRLIAIRAGLLFTALLALSTQTWSLDWFADFATPAVFMVILGAGLFVHSKLASRIDETLSGFNEIFYPVSVAGLSVAYLVQESSASLNVINYTFGAFALFGVIHFLIASGKLLKIEDGSKRSFDIVSGIALAATAIQSVLTVESDSLIRFAVLAVIVGALFTFTKRSVIRTLDAWAASTVLIQLAIIGKLSNGDIQTIWLIELPAIAFLLTGAVYIALRSRIRKSTGNAEFAFAPRVLPLRILAISIVGVFAAGIMSLYSPVSYQNSQDSIAVPLTIAIYLLVSGLFISRRWSKNIVEDADLAVARSVPIIWVFGFFALIEAKMATGGFLFIWLIMYLSLWTAVYFAGIAVLSYITAFFRKSSVQAFAGYAAGVLTTFYLVADNLINNRGITIDLLFLVGALGFYILTTFVLKKINYSFDKSGWPTILPVSVGISLLFAPISSMWSGDEINPALVYTEMLVSLGLAVVALFMSRGTYLGEPRFTRVPMLISSVLLYLSSYRYTGISATDAETEYKMMIVAAVAFAALAVFIRRFKAPVAIYASLIAAIQLAFAGTALILRAVPGASEFEYELIGLIAAAAIATVVPKLSELYSDRWKSIIRQGLPLSVLLVPGVLAVYSVVSADFTGVSQFKMIEAMGLIVATCVLLTVGVRIGNLGIALASGTFLTVTVLPILWQSITQVSDDRTKFELQALFIGLVIYGILAGLRATFKLQMNSLIYIGVPALIALLPTLFGVIGKLGTAGEDATAADWTRLAIVLGVSVVFLLLGSVRKLAGFFVPGGISLVVTVIPLLWTRMTALESAGVVIGLLLLAGLIGFVAVRLEQVKGSAKNASKWLRELK